MKFCYIANIRIPTERAHGIQIAKTCEALADAGTELILVVPRRMNTISKDVYEYYGVKKNFKIVFLPTIDLIHFGKVGFVIQSLLFAVGSFLYLIGNRADFVYSRNRLPLLCTLSIKSKKFWEVHDAKEGFLTDFLLKKLNGVVAISNGLRNFYVQGGFSQDKITVAPDGVSISHFIISENKMDVRKKLDLPTDKKIVLYTGQLYGWKGVQTLADAVSFLGPGTQVVFVGGSAKHQADFRIRNSSQNILLLPQQTYDRIPLYLKSADVLVLPNTAKESISKLYTSPMKLFEYMASGVPIVASKIPSICEILNSNNAILVEADNPKTLAEGIDKIFETSLYGEDISRQAQKDSLRYDWSFRAKTIVNFIIR
jgi:glycosyltransferase involved in cell wall biosynthesis